VTHFLLSAFQMFVYMLNNRIKNISEVADVIFDVALDSRCIIFIDQNPAEN